MTDLMTSMESVQLCARGWHAWVPWLRLDNGSWVTWCVRSGCNCHQQYDPTAEPNEETTDGE